MKISKQLLSKIKKKRFKPNKYKKLLKPDKFTKSRIKVKGDSFRYRLSVYRSNENIYAQIIDDRPTDPRIQPYKGSLLGSRTLISCSTLDRRIKLKVKNTRTCEASKLVGIRLAELCLEKKIFEVVFDRGPYLYHGRVKALSDGARAGGLRF